MTCGWLVIRLVEGGGGGEGRREGWGEGQNDHTAVCGSKQSHLCSCLRRYSFLTHSAFCLMAEEGELTCCSSQDTATWSWCHRNVCRGGDMQIVSRYSVRVSEGVCEGVCEGGM